MALIRFLISLLVLVLWAVIGLLFWIPLLARMVAVATVAVVASVFGEFDLKGIRTGLNAAVGFYASGFKRALELLADEDHEHHAKLPFAGTNWIRLVLETIYAFVFWLFTIWLLSLNSSTKFYSSFVSHSIGKAVYDSIIRFSEGASMQFGIDETNLFSPDIKTTVKIDLHEIAISYDPPRAELRFSICADGETGLDYTPLYFWYTDANRRDTVQWILARDQNAPYERERYLRNNECESHKIVDVTDRSSADAASIIRPFGKIHVSSNHTTRNNKHAYAEIDLADLDNQRMVTIQQSNNGKSRNE